MKVLYIAGWGRSGTTILDNILGGYDAVATAGELYYLWRRGLVQRRRCGCGKPLVDCAFWGGVLAVAYRGKPPAARQTAAVQRQSIRVRDTRRLSRGGFDAAAARYRDEVARLYAALGTVTGAELIVDSSKTPSGAAVLARCHNVEPYLLHMVRDPRAVAHSWTRATAQPDRRVPAQMRRHTTAASTATWVAWNVLVEDLARDSYSGRASRLRYEDFVANPRGTVEGLLGFAGVPATGSPFTGERTVELATNHTVSGNPGRFRTGAIELRPDDGWRSAQPRRRRLVSTALALPLLHRYGYPVQPRVPRPARAAGRRMAVTDVPAAT